MGIRITEARLSARDFSRLKFPLTENADGNVTRCRTIEQMFTQYFARLKESSGSCVSALTEAAITLGLNFAEYEPKCSRAIKLSEERNNNSDNHWRE